MYIIIKDAEEENCRLERKRKCRNPQFTTGPTTRRRGIFPPPAKMKIFGQNIIAAVSTLIIPNNNIIIAYNNISK